MVHNHGIPREARNAIFERLRLLQARDLLAPTKSCTMIFGDWNFYAPGEGASYLPILRPRQVEFDDDWDNIAHPNSHCRELIRAKASPLKPVLGSMTESSQDLPTHFACGVGRLGRLDRA